MNNPQFKIYGTERRQLKKELSLLKGYVKKFWHYHQLEKDMASFYGGQPGYPMPDEDAQKKFDEANTKIKKMEELLSVCYGPTQLEFNANQK